MKHTAVPFKKVTFILIPLSVIALLAILAWFPSKLNYSVGFEAGLYSGYEDGFNEGYSSGKLEGYLEGYDEAKKQYEIDPYDEYFYGYSDTSIKIIQYLEEEAWHYAHEKGGWNPEEAMLNVKSYINNKPDKFGNYCTKEDFLDSVMSLYYYYEFFYSKKYE